MARNNLQNKHFFFVFSCFLGEQRQVRSERGAQYTRDGEGTEIVSSAPFPVVPVPRFTLASRLVSLKIAKK